MSRKQVDLKSEPCDYSLFITSLLDFCLEHSVVPWCLNYGEIIYVGWADNGSISNLVLTNKEQVMEAFCNGYGCVLGLKLTSARVAVKNHVVSAKLFQRKVFAIALIFLIVPCFIWQDLIYTITYSTVGIVSTLAALFNLYVLKAGRGSKIEKRTSLTQNSPSYPESMNATAYPIYTILLPLYKEDKMLKQLIAAMLALDYPPDKLDIKIIIESDDHAMHAALSDLSPMFEIIVAPPCAPRTKARACNLALFFARGEFITIFDAEDIPEPGQLKKAVRYFRDNPSVACVQAELCIYNKNTNQITGMFSLEYEILHRLRLPGVQYARLPMALCGSSNHLRTEVLRALGGWDSYNVTEDAELGMRLYAGGYQVDLLDSYTLEEAPSSLDNWMKQRTRWIKGFVLTYLMYMRSPADIFRIFGVRGMIGMTFWLFASQFLLNILGFYAVALGLFVDGSAMLPLVMCVPNVLVNLLYIIVLGGHIKSLPLYTVYLYALMPIASFIAIWKLIFAPHFWEKTEHCEMACSHSAEL